MLTTSLPQILENHPELIFSAFSTLSSIFLFFLILPRWQTRGALSFSLLVMSMGFWQLGKLGFNCIHLKVMVGNPAFWELFSFTGATFIYPFSLRFAIVQSFRELKWFKPAQFIAFLSALTFIALDRLGYLSIGRRVTEFGLYRDPSYIYYMYTCVYLFFMSISLYFFWPGHYKKFPHIYRQSQAVFTGSVLGLGIGLLEFLPIYGFTIYPLADLSPVIFGGSLYYAIYRWNTWGGYSSLRKVGFWLIGLMGVTSIVLILYIVFGLVDRLPIRNYTPRWLVLCGFSLIIWVLYPLWQKLQQILLHAFFPVKTSARLIYAKLTEALDSSENPQMILKRSIQILESELGYFDGKAVLFSFGDGTWNINNFQLIGDHWEIDPQYINRIWNKISAVISKNQTLDHLRLSQDHAKNRNVFFHHLRILTRLKTDIIVPLPSQKGLAGFLCFKQPVYIQDSWKWVRETLEQVGTFLGYQVTQIAWNQSREEQEYLSRVGMMSASLAHEIKNPLEGIYGAAQVLNDNPENPKKWIQMIQKDALRLNSVVRRFLDFSSPAHLEFAEIDLYTWIENLIEKQNHYEPEKPIVLDWNSQLSTTEVNKYAIKTDANAIEEILENLIQNARRYHPAGKNLVCKCVIRTGQVSISIVDLGTGVPKQYRKKLFSPFFTTSTTGTGLGLATSRKLAWQLGGDLHYQEQKIGSAFTLTLKG